MARYTQKDETGRYYIESKNGLLESDIKGRVYGEAIDRFAELENTPTAKYVKLDDVLNTLNKNSITKKITFADGVSIYDAVKNIPTADVKRGAK